MQGVLVVGAGFIGTHVAAALRDAGATVSLLARRPPIAPQARVRLQGIHSWWGDAADPEAVGQALIGVDEVVFCASGLLPPDAHRTPVRDVRAGLLPLITVLEALRHRGNAGLTLLSSGGTVYGEPRWLPVDEGHPTEPLSVYGAGKLAAEAYVALYQRTHGVRGRILRLANVYGPGQLPDRGQGAVGTFLQRALDGRPVELIGAGAAVRDFLFVGDAAGAIAALATHPTPLIVNVGSGVGTSVLELLHQVENVTGRVLPVIRRPGRPQDVDRLVLDTRRLRGLVPSFMPAPLSEGLRRTWSSLQEGARFEARVAT